MKKITLYTKNSCPQCKMVKKFLKDKGIDSSLHSNVEFINLDESNPSIIEDLKEKGIFSVPFLIGTYNDEKEDLEIKGFRPDLLRQLTV